MSDMLSSDSQYYTHNNNNNALNSSTDSVSGHNNNNNENMILSHNNSINLSSYDYSNNNILRRSQLSMSQPTHNNTQRNILQSLNSVINTTQPMLSQQNNKQAVMDTSISPLITAYNKHVRNIDNNNIDDANYMQPSFSNQQNLTISELQSQQSQSATCISCNSPVTKCRKQISKTYNDKSSFSGEICSRTGKRWGMGIFINRHGDKYDGEWCDDKRSGRGSYIWNSGDIYEGEWKNGTMDGIGM